MRFSISVPRPVRVRPNLMLIVLMVSLIAPVAPVVRVVDAATTIPVNTTEDVLSSDGHCSLREAIIAANKNVASGGGPGECPAGSGADTVVIPAGDYILTRTDNGREDSSATGDLDIRESVLVLGEGRVRIAGGPGFSDRVFDVLSGQATLENVTIDGGNSRYDGGAIRNRGTVTLDKVTLVGNRTALDGGAIYNQGSAQLTNVTVSGNFAGASGGGLSNASGTMNLNNVTIAFNTADADGDGMGDGGGVSVTRGVFAPANSLIGRNLDLSPVVRRPDCSGAVQSQGNNLIQDTAGCTITGSAAGDVTGQDPALGPLAGNEGLTDTHVLLIGSPALGAGSPLVPGSGGLACAGLDQRGLARPSGPRCDMGAFERQAANDSWPAALELALTGDPLSAVYQQQIDQPGQSRWYRFDVQPQSRLVVTLTNLTANYDLTVYRDIAEAFQDVTTPDDLERLGAESAPDAFSPDAFSPDAFSPDAFSPDAFSPDAFSPDAFSPDAFSPDAFSPDAFSPDAFSPDAFSPDAFSPDAFSPDAFSPDAFSPDAFSPDAFSPDAFSSAQSRSLVAVSAFNGTAGEGVSLNTHLNEGDYYVRVRGRNGAFDPAGPFTLGVGLLTGVCRDVAPITVPPTLIPVSGGYRTIVLMDVSRLEGSEADKAALQSRLGEFIARPEVQGVVLDVGVDARVGAANAQADLYPACPYAKNQVAEAIRAVVRSYRDSNPLEYVVIIGNDNAIPFFRHPDQALLASEVNFVPPVLDSTASQASLRQGYVWSQDDYGAAVDIAVKDDAFPAPGLAVGRLVETAAEAAGMLEAYLMTPDGVVPTPQRTLVTGYDFLEDAARAVQAELEAGTGIPADILIAPRDLSPLDPASWTADDLRQKLLGGRVDLVFLAGHFSASSALAADYTTRLRTSDLVASTVDLSNAIIFSAGCHSGYNIVNSHGVPGVTQEPDWAQASAQKRATLIAGTGYQYGDTDFLKYSEELYYQFSRQLRMGAGPVALGKALAAAKHAYLLRVSHLRGIDEKALLQASLFGLPMLSIDMPGARLSSDVEPPVVGGINPFSSDPGATLGLGYSDVSLAPSLTARAVELTDVQGGGMVTATYLEGSDGVASGPAEPVLPLESYNANVSGTVLRGVGFRGGAYTDLPDIQPLVNAATTEIRGVHSPFLSEVYYPVRLTNINYYGALADSGDGETRLMLTPAQFRSSSPGSPRGTLRQYHRVDLRLFYSSNVSTYSGRSQPALAGAPAIVSVASEVTGSVARIAVRVVGDPAAGVQNVWITFTATGGPFAGIWQSLDLTQSASDSSQWEGSLDLGGTAADDVRFLVQAVNGVGLVALDANLGAYYIPARSEQPTVPTALALERPATTGLYGSQISFYAILTAGGAPLSGLPVTFRLGPQSRLAFTDGSGRATATLSLLGIPGPNEIGVSFAGTSVYVASSTASPFSIEKQPTSITLTMASATDIAAGAPLVSAVLQDSTGRRLGEKTIFFVIGDYAVAEITDYAGTASLWDIPLPPGDYAVTAYFAGLIPLPTATLALVDERYEPSTAGGTLTIPQNAPPACDSAYSAPAFLWSVDKQFYAITVMGITDPDGDPVTMTVTGIFQDEPVGGGTQSPDGLGVGTGTAEVRAERDGEGDGRVYHIYFEAADGAGGTCSGEVRVGVTHDQSKPVDAIDGGPTHDSTVPG